MATDDKAAETAEAEEGSGVIIEVDGVEIDTRDIDAIGRVIYDIARPKELTRKAVVTSVLGLAAGFASACERQMMTLEQAGAVLEIVWQGRDERMARKKGAH